MDDRVRVVPGHESFELTDAQAEATSEVSTRIRVVLRSAIQESLVDASDSFTLRHLSVPLLDRGGVGIGHL